MSKRQPTRRRGDLPDSEIRRHYFLDRYTIIAPSRNLRPDTFGHNDAGHRLETPTSPAIEKEPGILELKDDKGKWQVKVIVNAFPALSLDNPKAYGKQEIVVETPEHNVEFSQLPISHIEQIFSAYIERVKELKKLKGIRYVSVFKNDGPKAGASLAHAHSQIIALPLLPPGVEEEAMGFDEYFRHHQTCPICDINEWELSQKVRIIFEDKHIVAFSPFAGRYPFGAYIVPKRHVPTFGELAEKERQSIAIILKKIAAKLDSANISFNFFLQDSLDKQNHHFVLKVEPRPNVWAGLELSTGMVINPVPPEYSALWYKDKISQ